MANKPNNPSLWSRAKSLARQKFDVYPSAYANGWAAKWYKGKGGTWRKAEYGMEVMEEGGVPDNEGFNALPERVQQMIISRMEQGGEKMPPEIARARFAAAGNMDQMSDYGYAYGGMTYPFMADGGEPNGGMALGQMAAVQDKMNKLLQFVKPDDNLDPWIASKLAVMDHSADAIADYMMYNPEAQQEDQMMANGGYVVSRSNDRKGKTHKVTGPDGTVKYFGDSKLGQHPKDPGRKKAFYARHKKNLAGNPYFRAFARKTWEEGGEIEEMKNGGSTYANGVWYQEGGQNQDSIVENITEIFDPTGISSWDDVYRSYKKSGFSPETNLEIFGAIPLLGKVAKAGQYLGKLGKAAAVTARQKNNVKAVSKGLQAAPYIGRGTDGAQAAQSLPSAPIMPNFGMDNMPFGMGGYIPDLSKYQSKGQVDENDTDYIQSMFSMEQPQKMPALNPIPGSMPPQVNYNGKQQAYLSDMYGSGMMTFDNKQQMDLTGQGVNNYAWDSYGQNQSASGKTAAMREADKPFQIEQQEAINPIYGDVEKLQGMLNVASRKDLKSSVQEFNNTYGSDMKVPGSYMGADGKKATRRINNLSDFLRKGISTASGVTDVFNMRKGKREQEWRDRNLGSTSSLYPVVPENMSGNRGDYVVTGSRYGDFRPDEKTVNLGQYTGKFYPQSNMQFGGGIIDEQLSLPEELMQDPAASMEIPEESNAAYENNTTPVNFNLTKDYKEYATIANNFIKQVNPDTDITGEMLAYGAQMAEKKYGKTVPVELALAQLQQEGYLAKTNKPNRPQRTKNPFNVGNTDDGSNIPHNDLQSGIDSYYKLMATNYLSTRTPDQLLQNFVNKSGNRYASAENYESSLRNIIAKINKTRQTKFEAAL
jgi:hypothetical protein